TWRSEFNEQMSAIVRWSPALIRQARQAQVLTVAWMVVEGVVAVTAGVVARSVALTAFGFDSAIEVFTAVVVLDQLSRARNASEDDLRAGARRASRMVGYGLYGVAAYILLSSAWTLVRGIHPDPSLPGIALASASVLIMPALWRWRLGLSDRP